MDELFKEGMRTPPFSVDRFEENLELFKTFLDKIIAQKKEERSDSAVKPQDTIDYEHFYKEVVSLFGDNMNTQEIKTFFRKISSNPEAPIDWSEIFGYFQSEESILDSQMDEENSVFMVSKRERIENATGGGKKRRDTIQCIVKVPQMEAIITASEKGTLSWYNNKFLQMKMQATINTNEGSWMTGCDFLHQLRRIVAVTERSIVVWDHKCLGKNQDNYLSIKPMENCLLCVCTVVTTESQAKDDILIGDDSGFVHLFSIASEELNIKVSKVKQVLCPAVLDAKNFKKIRRKLHNDWVLKVKFFPELKCFASCSLDSQHSFVLDHLRRLKESGPVRELSVPRGVNAFAYCRKANIIATGGFDKVIRLWHPNIFSKPVGKLVGHLYAITEIVINEKDQHIISLSTARGFKVWDIQTLTLLQVFLDTGEGPGDRAIRSMIFDAKHLRLITGSCVMDLWPLTRMIQDTRQAPHTHDRSINVMVYIRALHQVLTICSESIVKVWELETGYQIYEIANAHGRNIEVTAADIDGHGFHLVTGAINGSVKIWDFGKGQEMKVISPHDIRKMGERKICQLIYLMATHQQHIILALEQSGRIKMIQAKEEDHYLTVLLEFPETAYPRPITSLLQPSMERSRSIIEDQLLLERSSSDFRAQNSKLGRYVICFDMLNQEGYYLLATGSTNGLLTLWNLHSTTVQHEFQVEKSEDQGEQPTFGSVLKLRRVNAVKFLFPLPKLKAVIDKRASSAMSSSLQQTESEHTNKSDESIDRHLSESQVKDEGEKEQWELQTAFSNTSELVIRHENVPVLASGHEDGNIYLWNIQGELLKTVFPAIKYHSVPLTALCTDTRARVLLAGNKEGYIIFWTIGLFLENPPLGTKSIQQQICWKAHSLKVVSLFYAEERNIVVSASEDSSVRLWYASTGHYIGYFGQRRVFQLSELGEFALPCDINEMPIKAKPDGDPRSILDKKQKYEYPLIFDKDRWETVEETSITLKEEEDHKYFRSLASPKVKRIHLESFTSGDRESGAVFRALPIYKFPNLQISYIPPSCVDAYKEHEPSPSASKTKMHGSRRGSKLSAGKPLKAINNRSLTLPPLASPDPP
ncbi:WD repeat-containing protein 64 [Rhinatrema bivittatum]|uniref:WD repeat-containing protein 64 n=1 Tax=Rhinatrema bivittatum TaxID=194408 RepID=UPI00112863E6|nr:WD repeat-containing protein 64 [Rhinatrema bivittatum]